MVVRSFSVAVVATFIFGLGFFPTLYVLVQFFSKIAGYSTLRTGFALSALPIMATIASNVTGRLADRFGYRTVIVPGILSFTLGAIWLRLNAGEDPNYVIDVLPGLMLIGIGIGAGPAILAAAAVSEMEPKYFSLAGAATQTARHRRCDRGRHPRQRRDSHHRLVSLGVRLPDRGLGHCQPGLDTAARSSGTLMSWTSSIPSTW